MQKLMVLCRISIGAGKTSGQSNCCGFGRKPSADGLGPAPPMRESVRGWQFACGEFSKSRIGIAGSLRLRFWHSRSQLAPRKAIAGIRFPAQASVRIFVPYGPGGVGDVTTRLVADKLSEQLKQQFVVENRPAALEGSPP